MFEGPGALKGDMSLVSLVGDLSVSRLSERKDELFLGVRCEVELRERIDCIFTQNKI